MFTIEVCAVTTWECETKDISRVEKRLNLFLEN